MEINWQTSQTVNKLALFIDGDVVLRIRPGVSMSRPGKVKITVTFHTQGSLQGRVLLTVKILVYFNPTQANGQAYVLITASRILCFRYSLEVTEKLMKWLDA